MFPHPRPQPLDRPSYTANTVAPSSKMSFDPPTYLNSLQNNSRARPIPWDGAVRAGTITEQDQKKIKAVDKVRKEQRRKTVEDNFGAYRDMFLGSGKDKSILESAAKRPDVVQYILVLAGDLLNGQPFHVPISTGLMFSRCPQLPGGASQACRTISPISSFPHLLERPGRPHTAPDVLGPVCPPRRSANEIHQIRQQAR